MTIDINLIRSLYTLSFFIGFICLCIWAYSPRQKKHFDNAKMIPFSDHTDENSTVIMQDRKGGSE